MDNRIHLVTLFFLARLSRFSSITEKSTDFSIRSKRQNDTLSIVQRKELHCVRKSLRSRARNVNGEKSAICSIVEGK